MDWSQNSNPDGRWFNMGHGCRKQGIASFSQILSPRKYIFRNQPPRMVMWSRDFIGNWWWLQLPPHWEVSQSMHLAVLWHFLSCLPLTTAGTCFEPAKFVIVLLSWVFHQKHLVSVSARQKSPFHVLTPTPFVKAGILHSKTKLSWAGLQGQVWTDVQWRY